MPRYSVFHETRSDASLEAYKYFREEITREDHVASQRITYSLALQGLLIASMTLIISGGISKDVPTIEQIVQIRQLALFCICVIGLFFSVVSILGIRASLESTHASISARDSLITNGLLDRIDYFPDAHGVGNAFKAGKAFPYLVMSGFVVFWFAMSFSVFWVLSGQTLSVFPSAKLQSDIKRLQAPTEVRVIGQSTAIQPVCQITSSVAKKEHQDLILVGKGIYSRGVGKHNTSRYRNLGRVKAENPVSARCSRSSPSGA